MDIPSRNKLPKTQRKRIYKAVDENGEITILSLRRLIDYDLKEREIGSLRVAIIESKLIETYTYKKFPFAFVSGLGEMVDCIFGKHERAQLLFYLSKAVGKLKSVLHIAWIYDVEYEDSPESARLLKDGLNGLYGSTERMLFIASTVQSPFVEEAFKKNGFISLKGVPYCMAGKFNREQRVKFRIWYK